MTTQYTVRATRDGRFWLLRLVELDQYTQARNLTEVEAMARDLVHMMTGEDEADIDLDINVELPQPVREAQAEAERLRKLAEESNAQAAAKSREAARLLKAQGVTVRELGSLLGVSHQRAQQLCKGG